MITVTIAAVFCFVFLLLFCLGTGQERGACDHARVVTYFVESINSDVGFRAVECETQVDFEAGLCADNVAVLMGDPTPSS